MTTYYYAQDLFELQKVTGKRIWDNLNNQYVDEHIDEYKNEPHFFELDTLDFDKDNDEFFVEINHWEDLFDYQDDWGDFHRGGYEEVYGEWSVDYEKYVEDDDWEIGDYVVTEDEINRLTK